MGQFVTQSEQAVIPFRLDYHRPEEVSGYEDYVHSGPRFAGGASRDSDVFQSLIYEETIVRLKASKCFREVLRAGEVTQDNRNVLVLQLSIVAFQEGKPCIHELMGVAGKARATAEAVLRNKAN